MASPEERDRCLALLERFLAAEPKHEAADRIALQLSRFYMAKEDLPAAYSLLHPFAERYPASKRKAKAKLYLGICLVRMDDPAGALEVLLPLADEPEAALLSREVYWYTAEAYVKNEDLLAALAAYQRCYGTMLEDADWRRLEGRVLDVMRKGWDPDVLQRASVEFPEGFFAEAIRFGIAASHVRNGRLRLAQGLLLRMSGEHPADAFTPHINALLQEIAESGEPRPCTVGCLLPLSGRYGKFGKHVLDALLLGARAFEDAGASGLPIRLVIRDTEGDPEKAVGYVDELAGIPELVGVVGPLRASVAFASAQEAQKLGLPMITLTQREDVAAAGDYIFQNGLTVRQQVDTLVEYVMDEMGLSSMAVLYPEDPYGRRAQELFVEKVEEMGGEIVASVSYGDEETDFQDEIRQLVGEEYVNEMNRREEERKQKGLLGEEDVGGGEGGVGMPGGVPEESEEEPLLPPFEVLFVPDHYKKVALIAPHLALYDLNEITLLGTNAWNSPHLVEEAGEYVRDAIFVDGFFAESAMPDVQAFVEHYLEAFQREPRALEAQAYDSLLILEEAFQRADAKTRDSVRESLANLDGYPGLSGYTRFNEDGSAKKRLYILSVVNNRIEQIY